MHIAVFTHAKHFKEENTYFSYSPFVREMNLWFDCVDEVLIVAPIKTDKDEIDIEYIRKDLNFCPVPAINFTSFKNLIISAFRLPGILIKIVRAMNITDHIHIRCPGNIGLLAVIMQIFFPLKSKTIKYAGNWDPKSFQPLSYRLQKWILNNKMLTRNAKVLVYGKWPDQGNNIISFFTSTYSDKLKQIIEKNFESPYRFLFVGTLSDGKRPLLAVMIIHDLLRMKKDVFLDIYGSGPEEISMRDYIKRHKLEDRIILHGNQKAEVVKDAYINSHFSILPSKSEGWPKALSEAMFFGCIPVATSVSCVSWMLGVGQRGIIIEPDVDLALKEILKALNRHQKLTEISINAQAWSQKFTLEKFKDQIIKFL